VTPPSFHTTPPAIEFIPTRDPELDNGSQPGKFKISIQNVDFRPTPPPQKPQTTTTAATTTTTTATTTTTRRTTTHRTTRPQDIVDIYNQVNREKDEERGFNTFEEDEISNEIITTGSVGRSNQQVGY